MVLALAISGSTKYPDISAKKVYRCKLSKTAEKTAGGAIQIIAHILTHPVGLRRHPSLLRKEGSFCVFSFFPSLRSREGDKRSEVG
jgi:hypothetical protein